MKKASKIMYIIATIFAAIALVSGIIMAVSGGIAANGIQSGNVDPSMTNGLKVEDCQAVMVFGVIVCVVAVIDILIGTFGRRAAAKKKGGNVPHIIALVVGVFGNIFFLLGGIFGLISSEKNN